MLYVGVFYSVTTAFGLGWYIGYLTGLYKSKQILNDVYGKLGGVKHG